MRGLGRLLAAAVLLALVLALPAVLPQRPAPASGEAASGGAAPEIRQAPEEAPPGGETADATPEAGGAAGYLAVWVSYLEWQTVDFTTDAAFTAAVGAMLDNIAGLGANVVLAQVRPFGDALYPSAYYPFSHLCTGVQGADPGYDPLAILVEEAHTRGLELEAWVNPYRLQAGGVPAQLCGESPALLHPDWVKEADGGLYLDPASPAVRQYIADALAELCRNYALDGIHFDDYFYPTTDPAFDAADYAATDTALPLADWRRANVDALVALCCDTVHRYGVRFGIAPQGDPEVNFTAQYSDTARWLAEPGFVDYLMPQLYWGLDYRKNGDASHSLAELAARWLALPRAPEVALYAGLGAYRLGEGDGGDFPGEWQTGRALADQLAWLQSEGIRGAALFRYGSLFGNEAWPALAAAEVQNLAAGRAAP